MLNYKIQNNKGFIRFFNWKYFLKNTSSSSGTQNDYAILTINFNNSLNIINLLKYISGETLSENIDLVIIENSYNTGEKDKLKCYIEDNKIKNVKILETINNLGSAGAYALGLEYIFTQNYKNIFIFEDDVLLLEENTFSDMIKKSSLDSIVYINGPINTGCEKSWLVQISLYPVEFLKKTGIPNPMYFTRSEDLELKERFDYIIKRDLYKEIVVNKNYFHPYLKKNNGQTWWTYFSIRNHLYTNFKWFNFSKITYLVTIFFYIWYAVSKLFIEKNTFILNSVLTAIFDFIFGNYNFENNKNKLEKFRSMNLDFHKEHLEEKLILEKINEITKNRYLLSNMLLSNIDRKKIQYSKSIIYFFKNGCIIGGYFSPLYPLFMLSKVIISIDEYDFEKDLYHISIIKNKPKYLQVLLSFLFALIIFIVIIPFVVIRGFFVYFFKFI